MPNFKDPKAFADSEDSQAVAEAKKIVLKPTEYAYTEVSTIPAQTVVTHFSIQL